MSRDTKLYLTDILDCIDYITQYVTDVSWDEFKNNVEKQDAVLRRLEIMGEAVKGIPIEIRSKYPNVPWREIAGLRDVLIHNYFGITIEMVWNVVTNDLGEIAASIEAIRQDL
jgi:uncharacterized protein with HEPN domain